MLFDGIIYLAPDDCRKLPALKLESGLFRKEVIHEGDWTKGDMPFTIDKNLIDHWINTFNEMQHDGIEVPKPLNHTENPEARRGTVIRLESDINENGKLALYEVFKFRNKEDAKNLKDADVSIYVPLEFKAGNGKTYKYPIRHIAFTDYPVIPNLGKMHPIAASFVEPSNSKSNKKKEKSMAKVPFGKEKEEEEEEGLENEHEEENEENENEEGGEEGGEDVEVTCEAVREILVELMGDEANKIPDGKLIPALHHIVSAIVESVNEAEHGEGNENEEERSRGPVAHRVKHEEEHYHPPGAGKELNSGMENRPPIAAGFISIGRKSRLGEINAAAKDGYITPAVAKQLISDYCSNEALQLAFSEEGDILDNFDATMKLLRSNGKVVKLQSERSQNDGLELGYSELYSEESNPLLKDAGKRAKAAGQA